MKTDGRYEVASATATSFAWHRIDDGKYKLEEVVTPAGYNTIDPVEFDVVAGHANLTLTSLSGTKLVQLASIPLRRITQKAL